MLLKQEYVKFQDKAFAILLLERASKQEPPSVLPSLDKINQVKETLLVESLLRLWINTLNAKVTRLPKFPIINKAPSQRTHDMHSVLMDSSEDLGHV